MVCDHFFPLFIARSPSFLLVLAIFNEFKETNQKYRNRVRSRVANLKDLKNPNLRNSVLFGVITPERMATLTADVRAMNFILFLFHRSLFRKWRVTNWNKNECNSTIKPLTNINYPPMMEWSPILFHANGRKKEFFFDFKKRRLVLSLWFRCKKTNCSYSEVQTRSADEPMTLFFLCKTCGFRWKVMHWISNLISFLVFDSLLCFSNESNWIFSVSSFWSIASNSWTFIQINLKLFNQYSKIKSNTLITVSSSFQIDFFSSLPKR